MGSPEICFDISNEISLGMSIDVSVETFWGEF